MSYVVSAIRWILSIGVVVVVPVLAVRLRRRHGGRRLVQLIAGSLAFIMVCALLLTSRQFGNARAADVPYIAAAVNTTAVFLFMFGIPVIAAGIPAALLRSEKYPEWAVAAVAIGAAAAGWVLGVVVALGVMNAVR